MVRRVAIIGHSGTGKSACLLTLGIDPKTADMDAVLGTGQCPTLASALGWLAVDGGVPELVVVSNHERMLLEMRQAKLAGRHVGAFSTIRFVYLHKPKDELREHLAKPTAGGWNREPAGVQYTLDHYDRLHHLFNQLADRTLECSQKAAEVVAAEVQATVRRLRASPAELSAAGSVLTSDHQPVT